MQLGGHPECVHHRPLCLRPHGPHLREAQSHQEETAQLADLQPAVSQPGGQPGRVQDSADGGWEQVPARYGAPQLHISFMEPCLSLLVSEMGMLPAPAW